MKRLIGLVLALSPLSVAALAQPSPSPYQGQEARKLKAFSEQEVKDLLGGEGMGLAKVAELNHYPGPRHVLDMAEELSLTPEQIAESQRFYDEMHADAVALGKKLLQQESALETLFASGGATEKQLTDLLDEIARTQGQLRAAHLRAHIRQRAILTHEQIFQYVTLRGYAHGNHSMHHPGD